MWLLFFPFRENHILYMRSTFKLKLTLKILKNIPYIMLLKQPHSTRHTTKSMIFINQNISTIWVKYLDWFSTTSCIAAKVSNKVGIILLYKLIKAFWDRDKIGSMSFSVLFTVLLRSFIPD